jgi:hypothetical protein
MRQLLSKFLTALFSFKSVLVKFKPLSRLELRVSEEIKVGIFICSVLNPAILGALLPYVFAFYFGSLYFFLVLVVSEKPYINALSRGSGIWQSPHED